MKGPDFLLSLLINCMMLYIKGIFIYPVFSLEYPNLSYYVPGGGCNFFQEMDVMVMFGIE
jgi:hypothetical protein